MKNQCAREANNYRTYQRQVKQRETVSNPLNAIVWMNDKTRTTGARNELVIWCKKWQVVV